MELLARSARCYPHDTSYVNNILPVWISEPFFINLMMLTKKKSKFCSQKKLLPSIKNKRLCSAKTDDLILAGSPLFIETTQNVMAVFQKFNFFARKFNFFARKSLWTENEKWAKGKSPIDLNSQTQTKSTREKPNVLSFKSLFAKVQNLNLVSFHLLFKGLVREEKRQRSHRSEALPKSRRSRCHCRKVTVKADLSGSGKGEKWTGKTVRTRRKLSG